MKHDNILLRTDTYKLGHLSQYKPGTTKIYSYLTARSDKKVSDMVFFGLQYYLKKYLSQPVDIWDVLEFQDYYKEILGKDCPEDVSSKLNALANLGYWPVEIKAVAEGTVLPVKNVLMTMTNTLPEFHWVVGFLESLLLKVWNPCTVASYDLKYSRLTEKFAEATCDDKGHLPFQIHDFGYRGCSSEETAEISGACHLLKHLGTDTIPAIKLLKEHYNATGLVGCSVPASEHSVMCSFGQENEIDAFKNMLSLYPSGIVSIVSDTYNLWNVLTNFCDVLENDILSRDGKVVFRPDSGDPVKIICGDPEADPNSPEGLGAIRLLANKFGTTTNSKGYKLLNPKVGLIYGDGMYYERFEHVLAQLKDMGFASSNLVIGIGGLLLQQHNRDDLGFAFKATYAEIDGVATELMKDPVTDPGKRSHKGLLVLDETVGPNNKKGYFTHDQCTWEEEKQGLLQTVYLNGKLVKEQSLEEIRERVNV